MSIVYLGKTLSESGDFFGTHRGIQIHAYLEDGVWVAQYGSKKVYALDKESVIQKAVSRIDDAKF